MNTHNLQITDGEIFESFRQRFGIRAVSSLWSIFSEARKQTSGRAQRQLHQELLSVLEYMNRFYNGYDGLMKWAASPSKENHIIVVNSNCYFIDIRGITLLFSGTFHEGEMNIANFEWYESKNTVIFDIVYIVHAKRQKCVCFFHPADFKVGFTEYADEPNPFHPKHR